MVRKGEGTHPLLPFLPLSQRRGRGKVLRRNRRCYELPEPLLEGTLPLSMSIRYVEHPRIRAGALEEREYQRTIAHHALEENVLAILPTGLGKTAIALRVMAHYLEAEPEKGALFLAPTRPLVVQHGESVHRILKTEGPRVFTGLHGRGDRDWAQVAGRVVVATPQVVLNDIREEVLDPSAFSVVVFDEVHRASGSYPYAFLARTFRESASCRLLGMTASPGNNVAKVREVMDCLGVLPSGLEVRDGSEVDVLPYLHEIRIETEEVDPPRVLLERGHMLRDSLEKVERRLESAGQIPAGERVSRRSLLDLGARLRGEVERYRARGLTPPPSLWQTVSLQAVAMKLVHAIELVETQGVEALQKYLARMDSSERRRSPSTRMFLADSAVQKVRESVKVDPSEHPKLARAVALVRGELTQRPDAKVLLFTHYRDMADLAVRTLKDLHDPRIVPARFVGQASHGAGDVGLSQKQQGEVLQSFRDGTVNCLVATSVAEEGLDIPATDLVIFYEPVPSEIRSIQRRGRTGRTQTGKVVLLVTRGTQDVAIHHAARGKENRMKRLVEDLKAGASIPPTKPSHSRRTVATRIEEYNESRL